MRTAAHDIAGRRFGRLVVDGSPRSRGGQRYWPCLCDCGKRHECTAPNLLAGRVRSCGCLGQEARIARNTTHGMAARGDGKHPDYYLWNNMRQRCENERHISWKYYGARGIRVCDRWLKFENFIADMGARPSARHSIDRINVDGNYEPGNCRWATAKEQAANKRASATGSAA